MLLHSNNKSALFQNTVNSFETEFLCKLKETIKQY